MEPYQILGMGTTAVSIILMIFTKSTLIFVVNNKTNVAPLPSLREVTENERIEDETLSKEELLVRVVQQREELKTVKSDKKEVVRELQRQLQEYAEGDILKEDRQKAIGNMQNIFNTKRVQRHQHEGNGEDPRGDSGAADAMMIDNERLAAENELLRFDIETLKVDNEGLKTNVEVLKTNVKVLKTNVEVLKTDNEALKTEVKGKEQSHRGTKDDEQ